MRTYIVIGTALLLAGCAHKTIVYNRPYTTAAQYNQDMGQCKLVGLSLPRERPAYLPAGGTAVAVAAGPNADATATSDNPVVLNAAIGIATGISNHDREQATVQACMQAKGYNARMVRK